jgi:hypothetical protein
MEQTAGEIQENHIPVDLRCCNVRRISWNVCQPGQNKHIDGTNSGFQDFDSTNYRYVLGDLGILFGSLCDRFIPTENRAIALI